MAQNSSDKHSHTLYLQNRELLELTGIINVESFNEEEIIASSDWGDLDIKGEELYVESLDLQSGDLKISGKVTALIYSTKSVSKGIFKRVFSSQS